MSDNVKEDIEFVKRLDWQIEALSFMFASVCSLLNWPEYNILF